MTRQAPQAQLGCIIFSTGLTFISKFKQPEGDADSPDIVMGEFEVPCAALTKSAVS